MDRERGLGFDLLQIMTFKLTRDIAVFPFEV